MLEIKEDFVSLKVLQRLVTLVKKYGLEDIVILWLIGHQAHPMHASGSKVAYPWLQVENVIISAIASLCM